jgi:hypothetical protein
MGVGWWKISARRCPALVCFMARACMKVAVRMEGSALMAKLESCEGERLGLRFVAWDLDRGDCASC